MTGKETDEASGHKPVQKPCHAEALDTSAAGSYGPLQWLQPTCASHPSEVVRGLGVESHDRRGLDIAHDARVF